MTTSSGEKVEKIRKAYAAELKDKPVAKVYGEIPVSYDSITSEWLTATLGRDHPGSKVVNHTLDEPDSGTSNRRRIFLEWNDKGHQAGLPPSVFCKATFELNNRIVLSVAGIHSETTFYNKIRPLIDIEAPKAYFAGYHPISYASIIILEDMAKRVSFCGHETRVTRQMVEDQFSLLANFHGKFYKSEHPAVKDLVTFEYRMNLMIQNHSLRMVCENGFDAAKEVIPSRLFSRASEIWDATERSVNRNGELPQTVVHSDVHLGNWYQTNEGQMGLEDWQVTSRGHWSRDLAYVLATALTIENRRAWDKELVREYLSKLLSHGGPKISEEEAWLELRRQLFTVLSFWTMTLTPSRDMPEMQTKSTTMDFIGRIATMMDDHDALAAWS